MDAKMDEVIGQYELHLNGKRRIRGGLLLETKEGNYTLTGYRENTARVEFDEAVKKILIKKGYPFVDEGIRNKNGEWLTKDHIGNFWHMKKWFMGRECNLKEEEVYLAAGHLARLHNLLSVSGEEIFSVGEEEGLFLHPMETKAVSEAVGPVAASAEEGDRNKNRFPMEERNPEELFLRRSREMRRVYNYIRHKKKRNEME
ncbi:MAG: hypothetical protein IJ733_17760, partial [Lachnospiraceae bacterium]|nr:hypothetical protein [Lachnospiraceae bacterium]